jgi:hypothetical protein
MTNHRMALAAGCVFLLAAGIAQAQSVKIYSSDDAILGLRTMHFEGGKTVKFSVGIGSGAYRHPKDPANMFLTVSDRGPNFPCSQAKKVLGLDGKKLCAGVKKARIYPVPDYTPSIYSVLLNDDGTFSIKDVIGLKDRDGNPVDGMLNPLTVATTENPVDGTGKKLKQNANAVDAEGIVKLSDGTYWIGEENGPSLMHVAADGRIMTRLVPAGTEQDFAAANYDIVGALPAIFARRQANRGIESVAISPDEKFLYTIMQNPLSNPNADAYKKAKNTRIIKMDRASMKVVGEWVYRLDDPQSFRNDPSKKQNSPRISEMAALGTDRLLVLERTNKTTKLHEVALADGTNILGTKWDDAATSPSLEQSNKLDGTGVTALKKTLRFDSADFKNIPNKLEGIAILGNGDVALINDNDFGIFGDPTQVVVLSGSHIKTGN